VKKSGNTERKVFTQKRAILWDLFELVPKLSYIL